MPLTMNLWRIANGQLEQATKSKIDLERSLEDWIEQDLSLIGLDAMLVGRQVHTDHGGYIDLLAITDQAQLIIIELKRGRTPREVVAQCLDYGAWVHGLTMDAVIGHYETYREGHSLSTDFSETFSTTLPEKLDPNYQMMIVAESLDDSSERIVRHLSDVHKLNINAVFFNVFEVEGRQLIGRSYLTDPEEVEERSAQGRRPKWTGYLFVNTGISEDNFRDWTLNLEYRFISAGGGKRWVNAIRKLQPGDKIFAYIKGKGYVGYGTVEAEAVLVKDYEVDGKRLVDHLPSDSPWLEDKEPLKDEWLAKVTWHHTVAEQDARWFQGAFANQNVVCKIRDDHTAKFLVREFEVQED